MTSSRKEEGGCEKSKGSNTNFWGTPPKFQVKWKRAGREGKLRRSLKQKQRKRKILGVAEPREKNEEE